MSDRPHLRQAIATVRKWYDIDARISDEKVAGMFVTQRLEMALALDELKGAIIGTGPGRRLRAGLLRFCTLLARVPGFR